MTRINSRSLSISLIALTSLTLATPALAQRGGGGGGQQGGTSVPSGSGAGDLDRLRDRDRLDVPDQDRDRDRDRDRTDVPDRDRDRLRDRDPNYDRDRDRLHVNQAVEGQLSTWQLLTSEERAQFHQRMRAAASEQERNRIRAEHQVMIQQRAQDLGVAAPFGPQRSGSGARANYFLAQTLSEQERLQFHQRMRAASTAQQRAQIRVEMQTMARERARDMGVEVPAWFGQD